MSRPAPAPSPGALLFFVLLGVTLAVAALVVRARTPDLVLEVVELSPRELTVSDPDDPPWTRISFFVRERDPRAEISIVGPAERVVRRLAGPVELEAYTTRAFLWDARNDAGRLVREGRYRVRVELPERDRDMVWPRPIIVNREPGDPDRRREPAP